MGLSKIRPAPLSAAALAPDAALCERNEPNPHLTNLTGRHRKPVLARAGSKALLATHSDVSVGEVLLPPLRKEMYLILSY